MQGKGPPDVLLAPGIISHLHITSHLPPLRNTVRALTRYARVVTFDKRGQGLSDSCLEVPDLEQRVHDIEAVMDAAGMDCPILLGLSEGGPMCIRFARDHPDRVRGLILLGSTARWLQGENFPIGIPERALDSLAQSWGTGVLRHVFFPGIGADVLDDDTYRGFEKLIAPRQSVRQLVEYLKTVDVTADLAALRCPTLVLHFSGDLAVPVRLGRAMAESVPNARFVELTGTDHADLTQSTTAVKVVREFIQSL